MVIAPDHEAVLSLLLERGQDYAGLATTLGLEQHEVRARARAALTELGGADPDRSVGLTDYLLGQADPIGRADASRHLREDAEDRALAATISERLRELFPDAELPRLPGEPRPARRRSAPRRPSPGPRVPRAALVAGGAGLLLAIAVIAIAGAFDGGGEEPAAGTAATTDGDEAAAVPIELEPEPGSDAGGVVVFGIAGTEEPYIQFQVRNLEQATNETAYVLWFLLDKGSGFPLPTPLAVQPDGTLDERIPIPAEVLAFAEQARSIAIALNDRRELDREIARAVRAGSGAIEFPGGTVLSAEISGQR